MSKVVITPGFPIDTQPIAYGSGTIFAPISLRNYEWQAFLATELQNRFGSGFNLYCHQVQRGTLSTERIDDVASRICQLNNVDLSQVVGVGVNAIDDEVPVSHISAVLMLWRDRHPTVVNYDDQMFIKLAS